MVNCIILGTIGIDNIKTPAGEKEVSIGGSATYSAVAASFFTEPGIVSIIGDDFPQKTLEILNKRKIDISKIIKKGKTFAWKGLYTGNMNEAKTIDTELNSLQDFDAVLPKEYKNAEYVFLGNLCPGLQIKVIEQLKAPKVIILDTMNFWISSEKDSLLDAIKKVDILILNDAEARALFEELNLRICAQKALDELALKAIIIKKGEHGAMLFTKAQTFIMPGFPLANLKDPTGCGDSFGGTIIGYIAKNGYSPVNLRKAMLYANVIASFNAEEFSFDKLITLTDEQINERYEQMKRLMKVE